MSKQGHIIPMRPCSLCAYFILTGADPDGLAPYAHCDHPVLPREIHPGADVLRCRSFQYRAIKAAEKDLARRVGFSDCGIGALITTDAKSQFETN